MATTGVYP